MMEVVARSLVDDLRCPRGWRLQIIPPWSTCDGFATGGYWCVAAIENGASRHRWFCILSELRVLVGGNDGIECQGSLSLTRCVKLNWEDPDLVGSIQSQLRAFAGK